jgi:hypothetical protein
LSQQAASIEAPRTIVACLGTFREARHKAAAEADSPRLRTAAMTSEMFRIVSTCVAALFVGTLLVTALLTTPLVP